MDFTKRNHRKEKDKQELEKELSNKHICMYNSFPLPLQSYQFLQTCSRLKNSFSVLLTFPFYIYFMVINTLTSAMLFHIVLSFSAMQSRLQATDKFQRDLKQGSKNQVQSYWKVMVGKGNCWSLSAVQISPLVKQTFLFLRVAILTIFWHVYWKCFVKFWCLSFKN